MSPVLVNIGFGNVVSASRVIAIVTPGSSPMKRLREEAKKRGKLVDATEGRRTRSIIITDSDHVILSALQAETITQRFVEGKEEGNQKVQRLYSKPLVDSSPESKKSKQSLLLRSVWKRPETTSKSSPLLKINSSSLLKKGRNNYERQQEPYPCWEIHGENC